MKHTKHAQLALEGTAGARESGRHSARICPIPSFSFSSTSPSRPSPLPSSVPLFGSDNEAYLIAEGTLR